MSAQKAGQGCVGCFMLLSIAMCTSWLTSVPQASHNAVPQPDPTAAQPDQAAKEPAPINWAAIAKEQADADAKKEQAEMSPEDIKNARDSFVTPRMRQMKGQGPDALPNVNVQLPPPWEDGSAASLGKLRLREDHLRPFIASFKPDAVEDVPPKRLVKPIRYLQYHREAIDAAFVANYVYEPPAQVERWRFLGFDDRRTGKSLSHAEGLGKLTSSPRFARKPEPPDPVAAVTVPAKEPELPAKPIKPAPPVVALPAKPALVAGQIVGTDAYTYFVEMYGKDQEGSLAGRKWLTYVPEKVKVTFQPDPEEKGHWMPYEVADAATGSRISPSIAAKRLQPLLMFTLPPLPTADIGVVSGPAFSMTAFRGIPPSGAGHFRTDGSYVRPLTRRR